jgi:hypothetical protein
MKIDLTIPSEFTVENVRKMIASGKDGANSELRVTDEGIAYLSDVTGPEQLDGVRFRVETWNAGEGYVGSEAAKDDGWVQAIYDCLKKHWPYPERAYVEVERKG